MSHACGILNVNKPAGMTSRRAVDRVVERAWPQKVGHAGTLDPLATGVLVVCIGPATRLIPIIQELPKAYHATFLLGRRSDTDDIDGHVVETPDAAPVVREQLAELLPRFTGAIEQVPPQFSAVHVDGEGAYKLARRGREVEISPRTVEIHRLSLVRFES